MQKMMTYSEANSVLGSSLTPTNRCLSKAVAIANDADPDLLANFDNARLVPANVIEPATHWIDEHTIEHYFVDEDGNKIGDGKSISVTIPTHGEYIVIRTKALLDGQPFPDDLRGGDARAGDDTPDPSLNYYGWVHNEGVISKTGIHTHATFDVFHNRWPNPSAEQEGRDAFGLVDPVDNQYGTYNAISNSEDGITVHVLHCPLDYSHVDETANFHIHIIMNDWFADPNKLNLPDVVNTWNISVTAKRQNLSYDINRGLIDFGNAEIGQESTETRLTGFGEGPDDYEIQYIGYWNGHPKVINDTAGKISNVTKTESGTNFIVTRTGDCLIPEGYSYKTRTNNLYKIYKKSDPSVFVYFVASFSPIQ